MMNLNKETKNEIVNSQIILIDGRTCYIFDRDNLLNLESNVSAIDIYKSSGDSDEN
jgi:hypothetical protein